MRNPEYQSFVDHVEGRLTDTLDHNLVTTATPQEIGWWKQFQVRRAIRHARAGSATSIELNFLRNKGLFYPGTRSAELEFHTGVSTLRMKLRSGTAV